MSSNKGLKVLVGIKRVIDYAVKVRVRNDHKWVETEGVKHSMNPFDEIAVEEAIRLKEKKIVDQIVVVSCGNAKTTDVIRTALAMGADSGIHIDVSEGEASKEGNLQPLTVAKLLRAIVLKEKPDLVILGKQAIDDDSNQTGQLLAGLLQWPQATFASEIIPDPTGNNKVFKVVREVEGGLQTIQLQLPAVMTTDLRLNEPRYASLQNIMKAKSKPITKETPQSLNVDTSPRLELLEVNEPPKRAGGRKVESIDELLHLLKNEAKVI